MDSYHVRLKGQCLGPYSLDRIRTMIHKGQVGRTHEVSTDGISWAPATSFPEIFERGERTPDVSAATMPTQSHPAPAPEPVPASGMAPPSEPEWYCDRQGSPYGPVPRAQLIAMIQRGEVTAKTFVFKEGTTGWVLASEAPELAAGFPGAGAIGQPGINAFCRECGAGVNQKAVMCPKCGAPTGTGSTPTSLPNFTVEFPSPSPAIRRTSSERKSKTVAAVLALLIGGFGIHHFYLGSAALGIVYLLFCWTLIPALVSFIEAIVFLTMTDAAFDEKYNR